MQKKIAILLLLIMGITIVPWQSMCMAHPLGHEHHAEDELSPCEIHRIVAQQAGLHLLPPMECEHVSDATDDFNQNQVEKIVPTIQLIAVASVLFDLLSFETPEQPYFNPPNPNCRSATLLSDSPLRAPPFI